MSKKAFVSGWIARNPEIKIFDQYGSSKILNFSINAADKKNTDADWIEINVSEEKQPFLFNLCKDLKKGSYIGAYGYYTVSIYHSKKHNQPALSQKLYLNDISFFPCYKSKEENADANNIAKIEEDNFDDDIPF